MVMQEVHKQELQYLLEIDRDMHCTSFNYNSCCVLFAPPSLPTFSFLMILYLQRHVLLAVQMHNSSNIKALLYSYNTV